MLSSRSAHRLPGIVLIVLVSSACQKPSTRLSPADAATEPGSPLAVVDASVGGPSEASSGADAGGPLMTLRALLPDGGASELASDGSAETSVDPGARFEVESPRLYKDVRVRLFDGDDRVVPCNDRLEITDKMHYLLVPAEPLAPGSQYSLVVDGPEADLPMAHVALKTNGEKPATLPKKGTVRRHTGR